MKESLMRIGGYEIDILVQGYPGRSVCHGSLGWSTVALVRGGGADNTKRVALVDAGAFGIRRQLIERLGALGLNPRSVTDLLLTHAHWDHAVNWTLFSGARIVIGAQELAWSLKVPWGETGVPELYIKELNTWPTLRTVRDGEEVFPGMTAHVAGGHTPGHLVYVLHGVERDAIFSGDAAKNRTEMLCRAAHNSYDPALTAASIDMIWKLWGSRPGNILVPGHDLPMVLEPGGAIGYACEREAAISSWFGDSVEQTTLIQLTVA